MSAVRPVLLAVAHGTRDPGGIAVITGLVDRVRNLAPGLRVELGFVDHAAPSVTSALARLAAEGAPTAVVPLLLAAGAHSKGDIPAAIQQARSEHPEWLVAYGRPLGPHPLLVAALDRQLREAGVAPDTAVVLVAAGSADPDTNADAAKCARLLWEWRGGAAPVEAAYAAATRPTVSEAIDRLRLLGHADIAVAPYLLAPGRLPASTDRAEVTMAGVLGETDEVVRLVLERYAEALAGDLRMNCDLCRYRTPWPGRAADVGAQQQPHRHPADG
ncbi:MAG: sirohydrochlorin chelatase [Mycobacteriales bacterium]